MSDDQLDDGFRDRVKEVFENYEDDSADAGWLLLREKYPAGKRSRRAIFWWRFAGVAACLALLLYFFPGERNKVVRQLKRTPERTAQQIPARQPIVSHTKAGGQVSIGKKIQQQPHYVFSQTQPVPAKTFSQTILVPAKASLQVSVPNTPVAVITTGSQSQLPKDTSAPAYQNPVVALNNNTADNNTTDTSHKKVLALNNNTADTSHKKTDATVSKSMLALFDKDAQNGNKTVQKQAKNGVVLGVYAASYVNYAKGSKAQFNNGGGLSVDIRISDRLSINTGILVAQNSLAYNGSTSSFNTPAFYSINFPGTPNLSGIEPSSSSQAVSLVNLDVPVNLTYQFNPQKGNTYFSAGLSSGTFINENYVTTYNYNDSQNNTQQLSQDDHKAFNNFYFGQMLNLAFGVGYPLGKNKLVIEPFFKYPLGGLGDQHILFGSGGLNLKFNFGPSGIQK